MPLAHVHVCMCMLYMYACTPVVPRVCERTHRAAPHIACKPSLRSRVANTAAPSFLSATQAPPEQVLDQRSRAAKDWPLWMYGRRHAMEFDLHWPMLVDGRLVTKEFAMDWLRKGRAVNVTGERPYARLAILYIRSRVPRGDSRWGHQRTEDRGWVRGALKTHTGGRSAGGGLCV